MKRLVGLLCLTCLFCVFAGCGQAAGSEEEMLQIIAKAEGISEGLDMQTVGTVEAGDRLLLCVMTGTDNQGRQPYAAEFRREQGRYAFVHSYQLQVRGVDLYSLQWADKYVFISNNANSKRLRIQFPNREQEDRLIPIDQIPFVYDLDLSQIQGKENEYSFEYDFLNGDGQAISS